MNRNEGRKYYIYTFGCKVNQADSTELAARYLNAGYKPVNSGRDADICIINTCTVTAKADAQCRNMARRLRAENPKAKIIMTGCYVNVAGEELRKMDEVDEFVNINDLVLANRSRKQEAGGMIFDRTRPQIKIQDGCDNFCSYCIVPYARGRSRSIPASEVIERIEALRMSGAHEVVLTGIHLGGYGKDLEPAIELVKLLKTVVSRQSSVVSKTNDQRLTTNDLFRIRLSSIDPDEWSDELIDFIAENDLICRHFHIPLQSGCDEILQKMKRRYSAEDYAKLIIKLKDKMPDCAIGADVIVGFPGETFAHFQKTLDLIKSLPLSYLHVFPYSKRPMTTAEKLNETATSAEKEERVRLLREISLAKREKFNKSFIGKNLNVVVENKRDKKSSKLKGLSSNYLTVLFDGENYLMGKMADVKVISANEKFAEGILV